MSVALVTSVTPRKGRGGNMWFSEIEKAIADVKDKICDCCITKITPNWGGGINFYMSNFTTIMWNNGEITIYKEGDWRK